MTVTRLAGSDQGQRPPGPDRSRERAIDEVLEAVWTEGERGSPRRENVARAAHVEVTEDLIEEIKSRALLGETEDGVLFFMEAGSERARRIIRCHRLAERLVHDLLSMPMNEIEANACEFEHLMAEGITESICTLLGHPTDCPHGRPIAEGRCCLEARKSLESVLVRLDEMRIGEEARVAYVSTKDHPRLHKLAAFGISPGVRVKLRQRSPAFVLECEETELAIEKVVARDIYLFREQKTQKDWGR